MASQLPAVNSYSRYQPPEEISYSPPPEADTPMESRVQYMEEQRNSKFYNRLGLLNRNDVGWEGVKQTENIIERIRKNSYLDNQRILQKFKAQADEAKKKAKYKHVLENKSLQPKSVQAHPVELPCILTNPRGLAASADPQIEDQQTAQESQENEDDNEDEEGPVHFRNVGVNTNKQYEISQLQKYAKLREKYDRLKQKYRVIKRSNLRLKTDESQNRLGQRHHRQYDRQTSAFDEIEKQLVGITVKINKNKESLMLKGSHRRLGDHEDSESEEQSIYEERDYDEYKNFHQNKIKGKKTDRDEMKLQKNFKRKRNQTEPNITEENKKSQYLSEIKTSGNIKETPKVLYSSNSRNRSAELQRLNQKIFKGKFRLRKQS